MDLITALKSGRKIRNIPHGLHEFMEYPGCGFTKKEILSDSWEIEPIKKEINREELAVAFKKAEDKFGTADRFEILCKELGL